MKDRIVMLTPRRKTKNNHKEQVNQSKEKLSYSTELFDFIDKVNLL